MDTRWGKLQKNSGSRALIVWRGKGGGEELWKNYSAFFFIFTILKKKLHNQELEIIKRRNILRIVEMTTENQKTQEELKKFLAIVEGIFIHTFKNI